MTPWQVHVQPPRQGSSHAKSGVPCQDAAWTEKTEFAVTAALCDGLGSLEYSQIAARAAACAAARLVSSRISEILAERGCLFLREQELEALRRDVLAGAREAVAEEAARSGLSASEMDCTLLLACLTLDGKRVLFGQLGDGAVCAIQKNRGVLLRARENPNRATSNETATVCSPDAEKWFGLQLFQFETAGRTLDGFLLTTDGLQNEIYSRAGNVLRRAEWYANAVSALGTDECTEAIAARWDTLASDERFGFTDDMSLIAVVRRGVVFELPEDVNWLCACGRRNRLESSRCESCGKDFLRVYKGLNFKAMPVSKRAFFARLNEDPAEELRVLLDHSTYPLEFTPDVFPASRRPEPDSRTSQEASGAPAAPAPASSPEASRVQAAPAVHSFAAPAPASAVSSEASRASGAPAARNPASSVPPAVSPAAAPSWAAPAEKIFRPQPENPDSFSRASDAPAARTPASSGPPAVSPAAAPSWAAPAEKIFRPQPENPDSFSRAPEAARAPIRKKGGGPTAPCPWCAGAPCCRNAAPPPAPSFVERLRARILRQRGLLPKRPCGCTPDPLSGVKPCGRTVSPAFCAQHCGRTEPSGGKEKQEPEPASGEPRHSGLSREMRRFLNRLLLLSIAACAVLLLILLLRLLWFLPV